MFAKVENGVTNSCHFFRRKNRKNANFGLIFRFFEQDRLLCVRVDIGVQKISDKHSQQKEENNLGLIFFFQKWACAIPFSVGNFHFFRRGKAIFLGEGGV